MSQAHLLEVAAEMASQTPVSDQKEVSRPGAQMIDDGNIFHAITSISTSGVIASSSGNLWSTSCRASLPLTPSA